jgi:hypothetical protein
MDFFFRAPVFPVVTNIGKGAVCFQTPSSLQNYLEQHGADDHTPHPLIDFSYEGFTLIPARFFVSPLTMKKKYTKKELLTFCGVRIETLNQKGLDGYSKGDIFNLISMVSQKK